MIEQLVDQIESRFAELSERMADPEVIGDRERYAEVGRAWRALEPAHRLAREYRQARSDAAGARELLDEEGEEPSLRAELEAAEARLSELDEEIRLAMVERDPNDDKNVIVEVRAGAGGEEAGLFAGDLYRMLTRYAERRGFRVEPISLAEGDYTFAVKGDGAYSVFKHEGGTHRVQRIPQTESQGRIHTSTATVAVLPEAEEVEVEIDPNDLQIDVYRSSGPGGQSVNTTDSAVRITHTPTGLVVSMQDEKSQLQNRDKAMRVLRARLLEQERAAQQAELSADRRAQVGTGERAEKVRTYNFPQDRVTDHRVKLTRGNLEAVLGGELEELTAALEADEKRRKLAAGEPSPAERKAVVEEVLGAAPTHSQPEVSRWSGTPLRPWMSRSAALRAGEAELTAAGCASPRLDAELLLADALAAGREALYREPEAPLPARAAERFVRHLDRRTRREPVAYVLGRRAFRRLELEVDQRVLVPRPETELLVQAALAELPSGASVHDVGTGSGAVALALKDERPDLAVTASDASEAAIAVAGANAARLGLEVTFFLGPDLPPALGRPDLVVANLPYVRDDEWPRLAPEIVRHEPRGALLGGGPDGLEAIRGLVRSVPGGTRLALEHAPAQASAVRSLLEAARSLRGVGGREDVTVGWAP